MVKPPVISLRIRRAEATTSRARMLLRKLDEEERLQRRVRWLAVKANASVVEMRAVAAPKLRLMNPGLRDRWLSEYELLESLLLKIGKRGV